MIPVRRPSTRNLYTMRVIFLISACTYFYKPSEQYSVSSAQMGYVQTGDDVTLHCFHSQDQINRVMWYKQSLGEAPALVASSYFWTQNSEYYGEFKNSKRFKVNASVGSFNLTILGTERSDIALYYCAASFSNIVHFGAATFLMVRGSIGVFQQPQYKTIQLYTNVSLQCTIKSDGESCGGEQKVYWFKPSTIGTIFTLKSSGNISEMDPKLKTCVSTLILRNVDGSDAGLYYCALVTHGQIFFGPGVNLTVDDSDNHKNYILTSTVALLTIISFISNMLLCVESTKGNLTLCTHL
ncbi:hypothetical protein DNTS_001260 [Danionella cerebrum]|uniref:Ig-like domain-containing protein n=1 Tax=Danionella cerebrum TaxID=2873325 RepID=A0A553MZU8_9TELE|nr:hypothetical protein DNTS_001260 [Danionella translucida]